MGNFGRCITAAPSLRWLTVPTCVASLPMQCCTMALELCNEAWGLIEAKKLYRALRLSQRISQRAPPASAGWRIMKSGTAVFHQAG